MSNTSRFNPGYTGHYPPPQNGFHASSQAAAAYSVPQQPQYHSNWHGYQPVANLQLGMRPSGRHPALGGPIPHSRRDALQIPPQEMAPVASTFTARPVAMARQTSMTLAEPSMRSHWPSATTAGLSSNASRWYSASNRVATPAAQEEVNATLPAVASAEEVPRSRAVHLEWRREVAQRNNQFAPQLLTPPTEVERESEPEQRVPNPRKRKNEVSVEAHHDQERAASESAPQQATDSKKRKIANIPKAAGARAPNRCSRCRQPGHCRTNKDKCKDHPEYTGSGPSTPASQVSTPNTLQPSTPVLPPSISQEVRPSTPAPALSTSRAPHLPSPVPEPSTSNVPRPPVSPPPTLLVLNDVQPPARNLPRPLKGPSPLSIIAEYYKTTAMLLPTATTPHTAPPAPIPPVDEQRQPQARAAPTGYTDYLATSINDIESLEVPIGAKLHPLSFAEREWYMPKWGSIHAFDLVYPYHFPGCPRPT